MKYVFSLIFLVFTFSISFAQNYQENLIKDSVCYSYHFQKGDTLLYFVESADSIVIDYGTPLLKIRRELLEVTVEKVNKSGSFILKLNLKEFESKEKSGKEEVKRTTSPWLDRYVLLEIDSLGNRLGHKYDDSLTAALTPGGAFQPYLFFPFKEHCKSIDESWNINTTDLVAENGLPVPIVKQSSLFRAMQPLDTLGYLSDRFSFVKAAQGNYEVNMPNNKMMVNNIMNGYGVMTISREYKVPVHYFSTIEQKLDITSPGDPARIGWHYVTTHYTLVNHNLKRMED